MRNLLHTILTYFAIMSFFSDYYNTAARIIVLMEETCNMFIDMARKFLDPGSIFQIEVEVAIASKKKAVYVFDFRLKRLLIKSTDHKRT